MKNKAMMLCVGVCIALGIAAFYSAGCHAAYQKGYKSGYEEAYWNGRTDGMAQNAAGCRAVVTGEFAASVLAVLPHAPFPHIAPDTAVVTEFQSGEPFCLYVGEEMAGSLETGGTYVFRVEEKEVEGVGLADAMSAQPLEAPETIHAYHLRAESTRPAEEGGYGSGGSHWLYFRRVYEGEG